MFESKKKKKESNVFFESKFKCKIRSGKIACFFGPYLKKIQSFLNKNKTSDKS